MLAVRQLAVHSPWGVAVLLYSGLITNYILHSLTLSHSSLQNLIYLLLLLQQLAKEIQLFGSELLLEPFVALDNIINTYICLFSLNMRHSSE